MVDMMIRASSMANAKIIGMFLYAKSDESQPNDVSV